MILWFLLKLPEILSLKTYFIFLYMGFMQWNSGTVVSPSSPRRVQRWFTGGGKACKRNLPFPSRSPLKANPNIVNCQFPIRDTYPVQYPKQPNTPKPITHFSGRHPMWHPSLSVWMCRLSIHLVMLIPILDPSLSERYCALPSSLRCVYNVIYNGSRELPPLIPGDMANLR